MNLTEKIKNSDMKKLIEEKGSICNALKSLGIKPNPYFYNIVREQLGLIKFEEPDENNRIDYAKVLREGGMIKTVANFKQYLLKNNILEYKCSECGQLPFYRGKPMSLDLEHKDGDRYNNKLENLTILCGYCHRQTDTHTGKNNAKDRFCKRCSTEKVFNCANYCDTCRPAVLSERFKRKSITKKREKETNKRLAHNCLICDTNKVGDGTKYCIDCRPTIQSEINRKSMLERQQKMIEQGLSITKISWPAPDIIKELIWKKPTVQIANELGVSDKAVEKYCKKHNISKPPRGYWMKSLS